jgi:glycosyltransferase involved in cell wall biosynthesis
MRAKVLCSISTRGRYYTTLPLAISAVINQTKQIDKLVIFDDNNTPEDMRSVLQYQHLFKIMELKGIEWEWLFAQKKGQHYNHQIANTMGYDFVWRVDDDNIPEPNVLETLCSYITDKVGAVGGEVLTPNWDCTTKLATGKIENIDQEPNLQWGKVLKLQEVDHLHCSFLYRAGIHDYNLGLSRVAHREETLFTWGLKQKGYKVLVVPNCVTWHLKAPEGGIRAETNQELYYHDEQIFRNLVSTKDSTVVVLNCGMGDHIVFKKVLPLIKNPVIFTCYPDIIQGRPIYEAEQLYGSIDCFNIYAKMAQWNWKDSLEAAFKKLYIK